MEEIIKQKDEEIKRLHEVYDIENVMKMVETLNDENDKLYNELMMYKNQVYTYKRSFNIYKERVATVLNHIKGCISEVHGDDSLSIGLIEWLQESDSSEDED
jgi:predicted RNase H-like nuclease (RuvC/YqgF family)